MVVTIEPQEIAVKKTFPRARRENTASPILIGTNYKENKDGIERGIDAALFFLRQGQTVPIHIDHGLPFILLRKGKEKDEIIVGLENKDALNVYNINDFAVILEALLRRNRVVIIDLGIVKKFYFDRKTNLLDLAGSLSSGHLNGMILSEIAKIRVDAYHKSETCQPLDIVGEFNFRQSIRDSIKSRVINESEYLNRHIYVRYENCKGVYKP